MKVMVLYMCLNITDAIVYMRQVDFRTLLPSSSRGVTMLYLYRAKVNRRYYNCSVNIT